MDAWRQSHPQLRVFGIAVGGGGGGLAVEARQTTVLNVLADDRADGAALVAACGSVSLLMFSVAFSPAGARRIIERRKRIGFGQTLEDRRLELAIAHGLSPRELWRCSAASPATVA